MSIDAITLAVLGNRFDSIAREITDTLLRSGRSAVITVARDFTCSIMTAAGELIAAPEALPTHVIGSLLETRGIHLYYDDVAPGDAFLHNDPYDGGTHHADYTVMVPVFIEGKHLFTVCAKAHQADCGNYHPTTYDAEAQDIYREGSLNFPCVRIQRDFSDVDEIIRMCRRRIRIPDQWYGDFLAQVGACRIGERRLIELVGEYGEEAILEFIEAWFQYSKRRMISAIRTLPSGRITVHGSHDAIPAVPEGVDLKAEILVDGDAGRIEVDLRDNPDCIPAGLNQTEATCMASILIGLMNVLGGDVPVNSGSLDRISLKLRENCVVGIVKHPYSASLSTTNIADRLVNMIQSAFAELTDGIGLAEGGLGLGVHHCVIGGVDRRPGREGDVYQNQILFLGNGGPATSRNDGWLTYGVPVAAGLIYRDSIEIDEQKYPVIYWENLVEQDSAGPGKFRGGPATRISIGPNGGTLSLSFPSDGHQTPPKGVRGAPEGTSCRSFLVSEGDEWLPLPAVVSSQVVADGERVVGIGSGGGGYGDPYDRPPDLVLRDFEAGWVSREAAKRDYGVVLERLPDRGWVVDVIGTEAERSSR